MFKAIYTHTTGNPWRVSFNTSPTDPNWDTPGIAFYAYTDQNDTNGLIPVYSAHANDPWRYEFSDSNNNFGEGWAVDGVMFYAYKEQVDGSIPLYQKGKMDGGWRNILTYNVQDGDDKGWINYGALFYAIPPDATIEYEFIDIEYDENLSNAPTEIGFKQSRTVTNNSDAEDQQTVDFFWSREDSFQWGLTEQLTVGAKVTFEANVPFIGKAETELSVELSLGSSQSWSKTINTTIEYQDVITVPAHTRVNATGIVKVVNSVTSTFNMTIKASATSTQFTDSPINLTGEQVAALFTLQNPNLKNIRVVSSDESSAIISFPGIFKGDFGVETETILSEPESLNNL